MQNSASSIHCLRSSSMFVRFRPYKTYIFCEQQQLAEDITVFVWMVHMYLSKLGTVFSGKCICPNLELYLSKMRNVFVWKMYLSKIGNVLVRNENSICLKNVFVQIEKCICPKWEMYLSKMRNVFVQNGKCICPKWEMYLSKWLTQTGIRVDCWSAHCQLLAEDITLSGDKKILLEQQQNMKIQQKIKRSPNKHTLQLF